MADKGNTKQDSFILCYRSIEVTDNDIGQLNSLESTPLSYIIDDNEPVIQTSFGKVPIDPALSYQVHT